MTREEQRRAFANDENLTRCGQCGQEREGQWGDKQECPNCKSTMTMPRTVDNHKSSDGWCNKCQSYCYGDCQF